MDYAKDCGLTVYAVGKISDIFNGAGITEAVHTQSNADGMAKTYEALNKDFKGILFTNLVDFDTKFGHRRDQAVLLNIRYLRPHRAKALPH